MMDKLKDRFEFELTQLIGKECWGVVGDNQRSIINLLIGKKLPRKIPINNLHLAEDVRNNDAEYELFISCVWRLDSKNEIICGGWDEGDLMLKSLEKLVGKRVIEAKVFEPAKDLWILFFGDLCLKLFCDQTTEDSIGNYDLFTPTDIISVGQRSILELEPRKFYE